MQHYGISPDIERGRAILKTEGQDPEMVDEMFDNLIKNNGFDIFQRTITWTKMRGYLTTAQLPAIQNRKGQMFDIVNIAFSENDRNVIIMFEDDNGKQHEEKFKRCDNNKIKIELNTSTPKDGRMILYNSCNVPFMCLMHFDHSII